MGVSRENYYCMSRVRDGAASALQSDAGAPSGAESVRKSILVVGDLRTAHARLFSERLAAIFPAAEVLVLPSWPGAKPQGCTLVGNEERVASPSRGRVSPAVTLKYRGLFRRR
jgi:hypothetical protein